MTAATRQPTQPSPAGRGVALLVLALLAGILGMHALGPAPAAAGSPAHHASAAAHAAPAASADAPTADCPDSGDGSGHLSHADATCAAAGVVSAYAPPALTEALSGLPAAASAVAADAPGSAVRGRAPPDLAELQLLRI
ncbi:DUF6153 family protein [Streptomyces sp. NPDC047014]|uniref:DUF6153 family protein n=1 Tax=Streptomyces sp. NPDC047014 TaxID=3155736 RepID=UPI0033E06D6B